jgi:LuxR family maltose regulon positive regulatory protein
MSLVLATATLAQLRLAQGDSPAAESLLAQAESQASLTDSSTMDDLLVKVSRIRAWLQQGDLAQASHYATALEQLPLQIPQVRQATGGILARLRLARGDPAAALALLEPLRAEAAQKGQWRNDLRLAVPAALALEAQGDHEAALVSLADTLRRARPEGYIRLFLDEAAMPYGRDALPRLLFAAAERGLEPDYAGRLLAALAAEPRLAPSTREPSAVTPLIEPLSERELEVLRLIAAGLSNKAIAERLVIALPTVKGHSSNIYAKLGVSRRTEAVARASALGLIA